MWRIITLQLMLMITPLFAHGDEEGGCLSHHWFDKDYTSEMWWQLYALGLLILICCVPGLIGRLKGRAGR